MDRYLLIERDGVLCVRREEGILKPEEMLVIPFVSEALFSLGQKDVKAIVLSDQHSIVPSKIDLTTMAAIDERLQSICEETGKRVDDIICCPNNQVKADQCAFPQPGLFKIAALKYHFKLADTYFVASSLEGLQAAWAAGCKTAFVKTGKPYKAMQYFRTGEQLPDFIVKDFLTAVVKIFPD